MTYLRISGVLRFQSEQLQKPDSKVHSMQGIQVGLQVFISTFIEH